MHVAAKYKHKEYIKIEAKKREDLGVAMSVGVSLTALALGIAYAVTKGKK
jgi:hypothetical protein